PRPPRGRPRGEAPDAAQVAGDVGVRVVQDRGVQTLHDALDLESVMRVHAPPHRAPPAHQADDRPWPPAAAIPEAAEVRDQAREGEAVQAVGYAGRDGG